MRVAEPSGIVWDRVEPYGTTPDLQGPARTVADHEEHPSGGNGLRSRSVTLADGTAPN